MLHPFELNGGFDMGTAQPIRNDEELEAFRNYYLEQKTNYRNYALICLGVNSALRISDILKLKWNDVYDSRKKCFKKHIIVTEKKTGKENRIAINASTRTGLQTYLNSLHYFDVNEYITSDDDFNDSVNHYKKRVYYLMAQKFTEMINAHANADVAKQTSKAKLAYLTLKHKIKKIVKPNG